MVRNFIWGCKTKKTCVKFKWDFLLELVSMGVLKIIDPKAQFKTFITKLLVIGYFLEKKVP
jgi:hypothetical protein